MIKWFFLPLISVIFLGGCLYAIFQPNPQKKMDKALQQIIEGRWNQAEKILASHVVSAYTPLYRSYIEQMKGEWENAQRYLEQAHREAKTLQHAELLSEITLAQAVQDFYQGDAVSLGVTIEKARNFDPRSKNLLFFEGLHSYLQKDYAEALRAWNCGGADGRSWFEVSLHHHFPSIWRKLHVAHCLIEVGNIDSAREILENQIGSDEQKWLSLNHLFLGLSYLKEAHPPHFQERNSRYKTAQFHLERGFSQNHFPHEHEAVISCIEKEAAQGLTDLSFGLSPSYALIHLLEAWKEGPVLQSLARQLASLILQQNSDEGRALCTEICQEFYQTPFLLLVTDYVLETLTHALKMGEDQNLLSMWACLEQISPDPQMTAKSVATLTSQEILKMFKKDHLSPACARGFISFWEKLNPTPSERELFARELLLLAKTFWQHEHQEKKGQSLMEMALFISNGNPDLQEELASFLTTLFKETESSNMIGRLLLVYDAMDHFHINCQDLISSSTIGNYLADAQYLYQSRDYGAAKTIADWVLKMEPCEEEAIRLAGLASFQMGEYGTAITYLKSIIPPDLETHHALMLSQVFTSQDQMYNLCQSPLTP